MPTTVTPFTTPGQTDRNVALAWTVWLLREDDSAKSILDAMMNGLAAGCVCGGCIDVVYAALRRMKFVHRKENAFAWTRRGAALGLLFSSLVYGTVWGRMLDVSHSAPASRSKPPEVMSDPWAGAGSSKD